MKIKVVQKIDENYYEEFYSEWLKCRSRQRKWQDKIGIAGVLIAIVLYLLNEESKYISVGLIVVGCSMIYDFHSSKRKWMKDRLESKVTNEMVTLIFEDDQIQSIGPFTEMKGNWSFLKDAVKTEKGIFLIPENGISIYLQQKLFENQSDINKIIEKIKQPDASKID